MDAIKTDVITVVNRGDFQKDLGSRFLCRRCHTEWWESKSFLCPVCNPLKQKEGNDVSSQV